jgi:uncharacterized protein (DUF983 family)
MLEAGLNSQIEHLPADAIPLKLAARRGALGRCPSCGKTKLFRAYLKQIESCSECSAQFGRIRADDAAPWLTIIVIGHVFLPLVFILNLDRMMPLWASLTAYVIFVSALALVLLPRAKGLFIGLLWVTRAPGADHG